MRRRLCTRPRRPRGRIWLGRALGFKAGQLVLFPSWLQHEVLPFYGSDERITIMYSPM